MRRALNPALPGRGDRTGPQVRQDTLLFNTGYRKMSRRIVRGVSRPKRGGFPRPRILFLSDYLKGSDVYNLPLRVGEPSGSLSREGHVMKIRRGIPLLVSFVYLLIASSLFAHHGVPNFDMSRTVTVKGVVIDYLLINPHMETRVKVTDDTGNSVEWNVEAVSLLMMLRAGYKRDTFKPGD